jgi:hypothetical protein
MQHIDIRRRHAAKSLSGDRTQFAKKTIGRSRTFIARRDQFLQFGGLKESQMLHEIQDCFDFMQRSARDIGEPPELLRALPSHAFGKVQDYTI